jgi:drug/metabolite transporter (DMT)-like permease
MLLGAVAFALMSGAIKMAGEQIGVFQIIFFRGLISLIILSAFEISKGGFAKSHDKKGLLGRAMSGYVALVLYVWTISNLELGLASALNQSSPVFVTIMSILILKERTHKAVPLFVLVAFAGVWMIVSPDLSTVNYFALAGLLSGMLAAVAYIFVRKLRATEKPQVIVRWFAGLSTLFSGVLMFAEGWVDPSAMDFLWLGGAGVFALLGQVFMTNSYRFGMAAIVAPFMYFGVVLNLVSGLLIWGEWPPGSALFGASVLIVSSIFIGLLSRSKSKSS